MQESLAGRRRYVDIRRSSDREMASKVACSGRLSRRRKRWAGLEAKAMDIDVGRLKLKPKPKAKAKRLSPSFGHCISIWCIH